MKVLFCRLVVAVLVAAAQAHCSAHSQGLKKLKAGVADPFEFCIYWRGISSKVAYTPIKGLKPHRLSKVCDCLIANPSFAQSTSVPRRHVGKVKCTADNKAVLAFEAAVADPVSFCAFWIKS